MNQTIVRKSVEADLEAILILLDQLGYPATPGEMKDRLQIIINEGLAHDQLLVAENSSQVVGLVHFQVRYTLMNDPYGEIVSFVIREDMRGQGIGTLLLNAVEKWALHLGLNQIILYSNALRKKAHQFYGKNGYLKVKDSVMLKKCLCIVVLLVLPACQCF